MNPKSFSWKAALPAISSSILIISCGGGDSSKEESSLHKEPSTHQQSIESIRQIEDAALQHKPAKTDFINITPIIIDLGHWTPPLSRSIRDANAPLILGMARENITKGKSEELKKTLVWHQTTQKTQITAVSFKSGGAHSIRLGILPKEIPSTSIFRIYAKNRRQYANEISGVQILNLLEINKLSGDKSVDGNIWWTPSVDGDEMVMEIEVPHSASTNEVDIAIPWIMHDYDKATSVLSTNISTRSVGSAKPCHLDSNCYTQSDRVKDAVAALEYISNGKKYLCTGTLLNNTSRSRIPYLSTANHCIASQTVATTLEVSWLYRSTSCNSKNYTKEKSDVNGARLLYSSENPDFTLLRLNGNPPPGVTFSGWSTITSKINSNVTGIHHPKFDLQKISFGQINGYANCSSDITCLIGQSSTSSDYYTIKPTQGATEGGSSGSGLFEDNKLVGILRGSFTSVSYPNSCAPSDQIYAKFSSVYPKVEKWLSAPPETINSNLRSPIHAHFRPVTGAYFFTIRSADSKVADSGGDFQNHGTPYFAYLNKSVKDVIPVHQFYNPITRSHFYTDIDSEYKLLTSIETAWIYEGVAWYGQSSATDGAIPVYRFYDPNTGTHTYTSSSKERDFLITQKSHLRHEGVSFHIWTN